MSRPWTRGEKALFLAPLLVIVGAVAFYLGPNVARRTLGLPQQLGTTPGNGLLSLTLSRDGSLLAATGQDTVDKINPESGTIYLWDARTLSVLPSFAPQRWQGPWGLGQLGFVVSALSLSPDGKLLGVSDRGAMGFAVYGVQSQKLLWRTSTTANSSAFSPDGLFVALSDSSSFELREARGGKLVTHWKAPNGGIVLPFCLSPDGKMVAWVGAEKKRFTSTGLPKPMPPDGKAIELRRVSDGKLLCVLKDSQETEAVTFSPDGEKIVSVATTELGTNSTDGSVIRCHSRTGKLLWQSDYRTSNPKKIRMDVFCDAIFSPDGKSIAVLNAWSQRPMLLLLDAATGKEKQQLVAPEKQSTGQGIPPALAFSPDGGRLFARGSNSVLVWDLK